MGKSIGIDLGTTNSVVAFKDTIVRIIRNNSDEELTRSCVAFPTAGGEPLVGNAAYKNLRRHSPNAIFSVKRLMGGSINDDGVIKMINDKDFYPFSIISLSSGTKDSVATVIHGKEYTPEEISAMILKRLKDDASEKIGEVTHAVITVPAYFNEKQKTATRLAAHMAGLKVQRLLSEPTAAAISYGIENIKEGESKVVLIYDFGGGTFDLSILVISGGQHIESVTGGDRWLGGDDIDKQLKEWFLNEICIKYKIDNINDLLNSLTNKKKDKFFDEFRRQVEEIKKQLSVNQSAKIELFDLLEDENGDPIDIELTISRSKFDSIIKKLISRTIDLVDELLEKNSYPIETIDNILLVGGSSGIPLVKKMLIDKYGKDKVCSSEKPMLAIAEGAAILAHSLNEEFECPKCGTIAKLNQVKCNECGVSIEELTIGNSGEEIIVYSTTHTYFIQVIDRNGKPKLEKIIDNANPLPINTNKIFKTTVDNQKILEVSIFADAENGTFNKQCDGYYVLSENLPINTEIAFSFDMDVDQILRIKSYPKGKKEQEKEIILGRGNKDSKCMETISKSIQDVFSSENISENKKREFTESIQVVVDEINKLKNVTPDNQKWFEIECKITQAKGVADTEEENKEMPFILVQILLNVFHKYIDNTDTANLKGLISRFEGSTNDLQRQELLDEMKEITDKYLILIHIFMLKIAADQASDSNSARQLTSNYNSAMLAIQNGDISGAISVLNNAAPLLSQQTVDFSTALGF